MVDTRPNPFIKGAGPAQSKRFVELRKVSRQLMTFSNYLSCELASSRRLRPDLVEQAIAEQDAKAARAEPDRLDSLT